MIRVYNEFVSESKRSDIIGNRGHGSIPGFTGEAFPTYEETRVMLGDRAKDPDLYYIYDLPPEDIEKYLDKWYIGRQRGPIDEIVTVKQVDARTAYTLYDRMYNHVGIMIQSSMVWNQEKQKYEFPEGQYCMKAMIHSVDDASYGIWWHRRQIGELRYFRLKLVEWINSQPALNGDKFIDKCVELGADKDSVDYN